MAPPAEPSSGKHKRLNDGQSGKETLEHHNPCEIQDVGMRDLILSDRRNYPEVCAFGEFGMVDFWKFCIKNEMGGTFAIDRQQNSGLGQ